jgi:hypothetical protein
MQFLSICLLGLMYFILVKNSCIGIAILVCLAALGWMKASLLFKTPNRKRFMALLFIDGGYFIVASSVFILMGLI